MEKVQSYKHGNQEDDEAFVECWVACGSHVLRLVLNVSTQLGLFDIIGKSGLDGAHLSAFEIASHLPTRNAERAARVLDHMLRVLVSHSFFTCSKTDQLRYGIAPKGKFFVADERGVSLAHFYALTALQESTNWRIPLKEVVLEGGTLFESGKTHYQDLASDPDSNRIFNNALGSQSILVMGQVLKVYNGFEGVHTLVDIGGGNGATLDMIISKHTWIKGINLDLPNVIQNAPTYKGVEHITGDMFVELPKGDAIMMKLVLHNWNDEHCVKLLNNCYKALPKKGKVIVMENILPEIPGTDAYSRHSSITNLGMLAMNGKERTKAEYEAMAKRAGFAEFKVVCRAYGVYVMELIKF